MYFRLQRYKMFSSLNLTRPGKEQTMDKNYYYQIRTAEHQREISRELATRNLLNSLKHETLTARQARRMVLRITPAVILLAVLLVAFLK